MITTVTLNPCVHKIVSFSVPVRGPVVRPVRSRYQAGGKGINVARAAHRLGAGVLAISTAGGHVGGLLRDGLTEEGIDHVLIDVASSTRMSTFIHDEASGGFHEYLEGGQPVTADEARRLHAAIAEAASRSDLLVLSGSSPAPVLDGLFSRVIEELRGTRCRIAVDTYGPPARAVVGGRPPYLFKSNREELRRSFGLDVNDVREIDRFVENLLARGTRAVVVSDGDAPAHLYTGERHLMIDPPRIKEVNPVGSGDAMLGAMASRLLSGDSMAEALRFGVAAGALNASCLDVCVLDAAAVGRLAASMGSGRVTRALS